MDGSMMLRMVMWNLEQNYQRINKNIDFSFINYPATPDVCKNGFNLWYTDGCGTQMDQKLIEVRFLVPTG